MCSYEQYADVSVDAGTVSQSKIQIVVLPGFFLPAFDQRNKFADSLIVFILVELIEQWTCGTFSGGKTTKYITLSNIKSFHLKSAKHGQD